MSDDVEGILEDLDFECVSSCEFCPRPATWRMMFTCCGDAFLSCSEHRVEVYARIRSRNFACATCHKPLREAVGQTLHYLTGDVS